MAADCGLRRCTVYDLCIVGAGMIGSAAARHATLIPNTKVCLVGPLEPKARSLRDDRTIYGAYYDEGRITRSTDPSPIWANLARKSIGRYRTLEDRTGIKFYNEVGCLSAGEKNGDYVTKTHKTSVLQNVPTTRESADKIKARFPFLNLASEDEALLTSQDAGYINPRNLVCAQQTAAHLQGCHMIKDVVCQVISVTQSGVPVAKITTENGQVVLAKKVLLCTGAFTSLRDLLPKSLQPDVILKGSVVIFGEIAEENAKQMRNMPCLIYKSSHMWGAMGPPSGEAAEFISGTYVLPPILYPDGRYYIKVGEDASRFLQLPTDDAVAVKSWFCDPPPRMYVDALKQIMLNIFQDVPIKGITTDTCVVTRTRTGNLYLDMASPHIGVALGGNGYAAKSSDEIGRIAAHLVLQDRWICDFPRENFRFRVKSHL